MTNHIQYEEQRKKQMGELYYTVEKEFARCFSLNIVKVEKLSGGMIFLCANEIEVRCIFDDPSRTSVDHWVVERARVGYGEAESLPDAIRNFNKDVREKIAAGKGAVFWEPPPPVLPGIEEAEAELKQCLRFDEVYRRVDGFTYGLFHISGEYTARWCPSKFTKEEFRWQINGKLTITGLGKTARAAIADYNEKCDLAAAEAMAARLEMTDE